MNLSLSREGVRAVVLDIEGTTTPMAFVYDVLFPFARTHLAECLRQRFQSDAVQAAVSHLRNEPAADVRASLDPPPLAGADAPIQSQIESVASYVDWLMDRDRKSTGLKALQGQIWEAGYADGRLQGQVYADVPAAFQRWRAQGADLAIFSSASVLAQQLLFRHCDAGDLTTFLGAYFDTTVGTKRESSSYVRIAAELGHPPQQMLFLSDVTMELDAAQRAGFKTLLCVRPSNPEQPPGHGHQTIYTFDEITN